jgi:cyclopropane-fatty-acyl-phospholipid synthase
MDGVSKRLSVATTLQPSSRTSPPYTRHAARSQPGAIDRWVASRVQRTIESEGVRLQLWDGSSPYANARPPVGDLIVHDRGTLFGLMLNPDLHFGEAYMSGRLDVRGGLEPVVEALTRGSRFDPSWRERLTAGLSYPNTLRIARRNVHHHYDLGNSFYQLWLDPELVYTCAYYSSPQMSLEDAQRAKLDLVCRKLALKPGDTVIEAGCGWGALALHMARRYGVFVKAFNVSHEQLAYARARAIREGLAGRVEFIEDDYRNVTGQFDAFVSIGMLEHVGTSHFSTLARALRNTLRRQGGRGLLHFIGRDAPRRLNPWIRRRIFPGAYTPTLGQVTTRILQPAGMSIVDVENLRLHYARTLAHWRERFGTARDCVHEAYGAEFARAWELYLAGSQAAFATGWMQLFQVTFVPRESAPPWWTRADLVDAAKAPE